MFSQDDEGQQGLVLAVVLGLILFVMTLVMGISLQRLHGARPSGPPPVPAIAVAATAPAPVASAPAAAPAAILPDVAQAIQASQAAADAASVKVEQSVVRFYFASGSADLAAGAVDAMADLVKAAKAGGRTLVISGFHDATGDAAKNAALAKQRAVAVRDALKAAGVPERQIELKKPEQLSGSSDAEARRVEISLQ
jgi:outer membrane protein OmpA-like peptidoglycan-associated protein